MKKFCKSLYNFTAKLMQSIVSLLSVLLFSRHKSANNIRNLRQENHQSDCIILGNGPSLKSVLEEHSDELIDKDLVAVALFCVSPYFYKLKPKYYVIADPAFFDDSGKDAWADGKKEQIIEGLSKVDWDMKFLVPTGTGGSKFYQAVASNKNIKMTTYNITPLNGFLRMQHRLYRRNQGMPIAQNVMCAAIFLGINLGYKKIYLLGADHSWLASFHVNDKNEVVTGDSHFYGTEEHVLGYPMWEWLDHLSVAFHTHERLNDYAKSQGVNIYNATPGSYVDAYERKTIS